MALVYRLMYRVGLTPWDTGTIPPPPSALIEGDSQLEPGRALDIGCGTGTRAVYLADLDRSQRDSEPPPRGPLKGVPLTWYRFHRGGSGV